MMRGNAGYARLMEDTDDVPVRSDRSETPGKRRLDFGAAHEHDHEAKPEFDMNAVLEEGGKAQRVGEIGAPQHRARTQLAIAPGQKCYTVRGLTVLRYSVAQHRTPQSFAHASPVIALAVSPKGAKFATACRDGTGALWTHEESGQVLRVGFNHGLTLEDHHIADSLARGHNLQAFGLAFSSDSSRLAVSYDSGADASLRFGSRRGGVLVLETPGPAYHSIP